MGTIGIILVCAGLLLMWFDRKKWSDRLEKSTKWGESEDYTSFFRIKNNSYSGRIVTLKEVLSMPFWLDLLLFVAGLIGFVVALRTIKLLLKIVNGIFDRIEKRFWQRIRSWLWLNSSLFFCFAKKTSPIVKRWFSLSEDVLHARMEVSEVTRLIRWEMLKMHRGWNSLWNWNSRCKARLRFQSKIRAFLFSFFRKKNYSLSEGGEEHET